ncbi:MAG: enoyl-CoA hydratase-related protein [Chitinophagales bacterium]|nr:enoyl-CoA hydratase-related protein [Chitinophagales bacterium]
MEGPIAYIGLNRTDKKNALNHDFVSEIIQALEQLRNEDRIRVIILHSLSDVFCAGADLEALKRMQSYSYEENLDDSTHLKKLYELMYSYPKTIIAQIEGHAIAGGAGLMSVCDIIYCVPDALIGFTEVKIGFIPALVSVFVTRKIGEGFARPMMLSGELYASQNLVHTGLITEIVTPDKIALTVKEKALMLAKHTSPQAIAATKKLMTLTHHLPFEEAMQVAAKANASSRESSDCKRGIQGFLDKVKIFWD